MANPDPEPKRAPKGMGEHPEVGGVGSSKYPVRVGCLIGQRELCLL